MKIYTRTGDQGETSLFGGQRVSKADWRVEAYGQVDEVNAAIGLAASLISDAEIRALLQEIQNRLFDIGADLATPRTEATIQTRAFIQPATAAWVELLERRIDQAEEELEPLTNFILPGGTAGAAALHMARTICRRAERRLVASRQHIPDLNPIVLQYLNRLSDLLFVLARLVNKRAGQADMAWQKAAPSS